MSMKLPEKLKGFNLFVEGQGYAGRVEEMTLPKLTRKMEEFRAGGMDSPVEIDMGGEKLEAEYTLAEYSPDVIKMFGLTDVAGVPARFKGAVRRDDGSDEEIAVEILLRGRHREIDMGNWKAGDVNTMKMSIAVSYYKLMHNGETLVEIDVPNLVYNVGGQDVLKSRRQALAI